MRIRTRGPGHRGDGTAVGPISIYDSSCSLQPQPLSQPQPRAPLSGTLSAHSGCVKWVNDHIAPLQLSPTGGLAVSCLKPHVPLLIIHFLCPFALLARCFPDLVNSCISSLSSNVTSPWKPTVTPRLGEVPSTGPPQPSHDTRGSHRLRSVPCLPPEVGWTQS